MKPTEGSGLLQRQHENQTYPIGLKKPTPPVYNTMPLMGSEDATARATFARLKEAFLLKLRQDVPKKASYATLVTVVYDEAASVLYYACDPKHPTPKGTTFSQTEEPSRIDLVALSVALLLYPQIISLMGEAAVILSKQRRTYYFTRLRREYVIPDTTARGPLEKMSATMSPQLTGWATFYVLHVLDYQTVIEHPDWRSRIQAKRDPSLRLTFSTKAMDTTASTATTDDEEEEDEESSSLPPPIMPYPTATISTEMAAAAPDSSRSDTPADDPIQI
jgi:hypothetical protein